MTSETTNTHSHILIQDHEADYKEKLLPSHNDVHAHDRVLDTTKRTMSTVPEAPHSFLETVRDNLKSGITVGLVNLSLCISLAVASGSTPGAGIVAGIYSGMVSGLIGGSHFNII